MFKKGKFKVVVVVLFLGGCLEILTTSSNDDSEQFLFAVAALDAWFLYRDKLPRKPEIYSDPVLLYQSLNEPYTSFLYPDTAKYFLSMMSTSSAGLGIRTDSTKRGYVILDVIENSPAETAGLLKHDTIIKVDDSDVATMSRIDFINIVRGQKGDEKRLKIKRAESVLDFNITIATFMTPSVFTDSLSESTAYILLTTFLSATNREGGSAQEFRQALEKKDWASNIILDLRQNGGGEIEQAISIVSELLGPQTEIITSKYRNCNNNARYCITENYTLRTEEGGDFSNKRLCVLMDENTASASEILISALIDNREDVTTMGGKSYGKGRGQVVLEGPQSCIAIITSMQFMPVKGLDYDRYGIVPDIEVSGMDIVERALEHLEGEVVTKRKALNASRVRYLFEEFSVEHMMPLAITKEVE
ncbi:S41 family peptidase [Chitinispirillales bacterium ANBcel5]|uniref:S41 family peptidase n=1 Tax=Cellulosispirillum alkaliphilum TaxID=3039283 RepID=UPI002A5187BC|nr:S41 family peptidase [Chitinispirillales bacterium ANBcel5]